MPVSGFAEANLPVQKIERYLQKQLDNNNIPGVSVAITHHGRVIYNKGFGTAGKNRSVTANTPFAIASLSKAFTAMAVMQLVEAGKLKLDTPVEQVLPAFRVNDPRTSTITVRHLLNQTSGLADSVNLDISLSPQPKSLDDVIKRLQQVELEATPGEKFNYHNPNYEVLARIVEVVSKETFPTYLQKHIFQPLEMKQTTHVSNIKDFSTVKNISDGHWLLFGQPIANRTYDWFATGSHGIISTSSDMAKWMSVFQNHGVYNGKRLLSEAGIKTMQTAASPSVSYAMGWRVGETNFGEKQISHDGTLADFKTELVVLPEQGYSIVLLSNAGVNEFIDSYGLMQGIVDIVMGREAVVSWVNNDNMTLLMIGFVLLLLALMIFQLTRVHKWQEKAAKLPVWWTAVKLFVRLIPLFILFSLRPLYSFIGGGREMSWEGIVVIAPCIVTMLATLAICNVVIVTVRLLRLKTSNSKVEIEG
jgi:CubicO group peptidase (beta-lactamase class C family)